MRPRPLLRLIALAPLLILAVALASCRSEIEKRDAHLKAAERYLEAQSTRKAMIELRNALKADPKNADTNFRIAELLEKDDKLADAIFFYGEAYRLDSNQLEAAVREAGLLIFDDWVRSSDLIEEVLEQDATYGRAYVVRAALHLIRDELAPALAAAMTAVELDPEDSRAYFQLAKTHEARIRRRQNRKKPVEDEIFEAAIAACDRAAALGDAEAAWLAKTERARVMAAWPGHEKEAAQAFRESIEALEQLDNEQALLQELILAENIASQIRDEELRAWTLERHVENFPADLPAWFRLVAIDIAAGKTGDAVFERMLEARGQDPDTHIRYAIFIGGRGRLDEAIEHLSKVAEEGVDPPAVLGGLLSLLRANGRLEEASAVADRLNREYRDHPKAVLARASQALEEGRRQDAAEELRVLAARVKRADVQHMLATVEYRLGNFRAALSAIEDAIGLAPFFPAGAMRLKAMLQTELRAWGDALRTFGSLSRHGLKLIATEQILKARCLYETGRLAAGRSALAELLSREDVPPKAILEFVRHEAERSPDRVRALLEKGLEKRPGHPQLMPRLVALELADGQSGRALKRLNEVIGARPVAPVILLERARVLAARGDLKAAQRDALQAFQARPDLPGAGGMLIALYQAQGNIEDAIRSFEEANAAGALPPAARLILAKLQMVAGQRDEARVLYEQIVEEHEDLLTAKNDLAYLLAKQGRELDRALHLAQAAQRGMSRSAAVIDTLGYVYLRSELYDAAEQQFRYALELAEESGGVDPIFHYHHGLSLRGLGRSEEAGQAFEATLQLDSNFQDAATALRALRAGSVDEAAAVDPT